MRTLDQLLEKDEPAWPLVQQWIRAATNQIEVLPASDERRSDALVATQVTTRSPLGAIIYETAYSLTMGGFAFWGLDIRGCRVQCQIGTSDERQRRSESIRLLS
jgi:hypothetical protein